MPDLLDELRELDPIRDRHLPADGAGMRELRRAVVTTPRPVSAQRPLRWLGIAAAAAVLVAAVVVWPRASEPTTVPAAPAASPTATPTATLTSSGWRATAAVPLSPRQGSITAWADGTFFVIGGDEAPACPATMDCTWPEKPVRDGARYDPATDTWSRIADAPIDVVTSVATPYQRVAVLKHTLFVAQGESVLAYDLDADQWSVLPQPPGEPVTSIMVVDGSLVSVATPTTGDIRTSYLRFAANLGIWVEYAMEGEVPGLIEAAASVDGYLVLAGSDTEASGRSWVARIKGFVGPVKLTDPPSLDDQRLTPVTLQTKAGGYAVWVRDDAAAHFYQPKSDAWSSVAQPATPGAFSGTVQSDTPRSWYLTAAGMITLNGHLYDPVTGLWSETPELPVGRNDPVLAGGSNAILACFGLTGQDFGTGCYLLRPDPATQTEPR